MKKTNFITITVIIISFIIGIYCYPLLPSLIISNFGVEGTANKLISKFWGLFLIPIISFFIWILFMVLPKIDPLGKNIKKFEIYYDNFAFIIILFLFYIYVLSILWNFNILVVNMTRMITPVLGLLFIYIGIIMKDIPRNWFIGIRTPWTMSNDIVWKKTHKRGSKLFIYSGIITFIGIFFTRYIFWFALVPVLVSSAYLVAYSYFEYCKLIRKVNLQTKKEEQMKN